MSATRTFIQVSLVDLLMLWSFCCLCLSPAACFPHLLLWFFFVSWEIQSKSRLYSPSSTTRILYSTHEGGCSHKEREVQCICNKASHWLQVKKGN